MLTLSHLANLVALLVGERPETMQLIARNLRQARLVASGGRGRGGARQEPRHVANMIIAACAADQIADVASAVPAFVNLELVPAWLGKKRPSLNPKREPDCPRELLFATRRGAKFGEVLAGLVEMAANGDLYSLLMAYSGEFVDRELLRAGAEAIKRAPRSRKPEVTAEVAIKMATHVQSLIDRSVVYLTISVARPLPSARIEFGTRAEHDATPLFQADFGLPRSFLANPRNAPRLNTWNRIDRLHWVTVSHKTLLSIGQAIAAEQESSRHVA